MDAQKVLAEIRSCVAGGDFAKAEALREKLMEGDAMALKESIEAAEIIDNAKLASMDQQHQLVWKDLYERLSPEESTIFFYSLKDHVVPAKSLIAKQGQRNNRLFFVEDGRVAAYFSKDGKNHLVLQLSKGGFIGEDTFFGMSICTSHIVTQSEAKLKVLEASATEAWTEQAPGLYAKIESYCRENGLYEAAFERKMEEENRFERFSVKGQVMAEILNPSMEKSGRHFRAAIGDISRCGTCFFIKASKKEMAKALLARPLQMQFTMEGTQQPVEFVALGKVVKVKFHLENDYSVHVRFNKILDEERLKGVKIKS